MTGETPFRARTPKYVGSRADVTQRSRCERTGKSKASGREKMSRSDENDKPRRKTVRNRRNKCEVVKKSTKRPRRFKEQRSVEASSQNWSIESAEMSVSGTQKSPSEDFIGEKKKPSPEGVDNKKMGSQEKELPVEKKDVATVEKKESSAEKKEPEKKEKEPEKKESEKKDPGAAVPKPPKKRVSSAESADGKKFNMQLAQLFFKTMLEQRKTAKTVNTDALLETMPEPAQMVVSTKVTKLKSAKRRSSTGLNTNLFKSNGEPVWLYHERKPGDFVELEDGVKTRWPELMQALMEDKIKMEDGKQWIPMISDYAAGKFDEGALDELPEFDPFLPVEQLAERTDIYYRMVTVYYYTMRNLCVLCKVAIDRFQETCELTNADRRRRQQEEEEKAQKMQEEGEKTALMTKIRFKMERTFSISYDRRRPIRSIQKLRKKFQKKLRTCESNTRVLSREGSRESS